ncbi:hypothetical protein PIIN_09019 [Serendipita indica DSM 11827]|uniref:Uncharacterized protein n=1 Tax=Serendipita indica (strain DSM 11827) TaxID=1109443 RepID=G4TUP1_SERID|nr:hypothetical protein PIIN_09019 [Serendipita indica DSM 11827]
MLEVGVIGLFAELVSTRSRLTCLESDTQRLQRYSGVVILNNIYTKIADGNLETLICTSVGGLFCLRAVCAAGVAEVWVRQMYFFNARNGLCNWSSKPPLSPLGLIDSSIFSSNPGAFLSRLVIDLLISRFLSLDPGTTEGLSQADVLNLFPINGVGPP